MKRKLRLIGGGLPTALCLLVLFQLAGAYLGGAYRYVATFLAALLFLDLAHLFLTVRYILYQWTFSSMLPAKNDVVEYWFCIRTPRMLPGSRVVIRFISLRAGVPLDMGFRDLDYVSRSGRDFQRTYRITFPFRGSYRTGIESLEIRDLLGMTAIRLPIWLERFRVRPRLVKLDSCRLLSREGLSVLTTGRVGSSSDPTQFMSLAEYREGRSIRHIAWKRFAATGIPFLKEYDADSFSGITIYLDEIRSEAMRGRWKRLEAEDCSIETLLALATFVVRQGLVVRVRVYDRTFVVGPEDERRFDQLVRFTIDLQFLDQVSGGRSLAERYRADLADGIVPAGSVIGIFRSLDTQAVSFVEEFHDEQRPTTAIIVASDLPENARANLRVWLSRTKRSDCVIVVERPDQVPEALS